MRPDLLPVGRDRPGVTIKPTGIVVHSTGVIGAPARNYRQSFMGTKAQASAHLVADWKETLVLVPCWPGSCEMAYHAGKTANGRFLAIEICEAPADLQKFQQAWSRATKVVRLLCQIWEWPLSDEHILAHFHVSQRWGETDHTDPFPYFARWQKTWVEFMAAVVQ